MISKACNQYFLKNSFRIYIFLFIWFSFIVLFFTVLHLGFIRFCTRHRFPPFARIPSHTHTHTHTLSLSLSLFPGIIIFQFLSRHSSFTHSLSDNSFFLLHQVILSVFLFPVSEAKNTLIIPLAEGWLSTKKRGVFGMILNYTWWWGSSSWALGSQDKLFLAIRPWFTLIRSGSFRLVWYFGISTIVGYSMPNPLYTYILHICGL